MEITTGRKYTAHPQPPQGWLIGVCSIQPFLFSLQKWALGNVLFYLLSFGQCFHSAIPFLRIPLSMAAHNAIVWKHVIFCRRWVLISWYLGSLFAIQKSAAIKRLVANYFAGRVSTKRVVGRKGRAVGADRPVESVSKSRATFPPRQRQCPHPHTPVRLNVITVMIKCRLYRWKW